MKTVIVFGTFDTLHKGHEYFLAEAKKHGDRLIVVVGRDSTVAEVKGKKPLHDEQTRLNNIKNLKIVDQAFLGKTQNKYDIIEELKPDIICLGYDQNSYTKDLKHELGKRKLDIAILRLGPYKEHIYKSSKLTKNI